MLMPKATCIFTMAKAAMVVTRVSGGRAALTAGLNVRANNSAVVK